jgi:hypothetical protein
VNAETRQTPKHGKRANVKSRKGSNAGADTLSRPRQIATANAYDRRAAPAARRSAREAVEEKDRAAGEDAEQRKAHCHREIHAGSGTVGD